MVYFGGGEVLGNPREAAAAGVTLQGTGVKGYIGVLSGLY